VPPGVDKVPPPTPWKWSPCRLPRN